MVFLFLIYPFVPSRSKFSLRKMSLLTKSLLLLALFSFTFYFYKKALGDEEFKFHNIKKIADIDTSNILESPKNAAANYTLMRWKEPKNPLTVRELHFLIQSSLKGNYEQIELLRGLLGSNL